MEFLAGLDITFGQSIYSFNRRVIRNPGILKFYNHIFRLFFGLEKLEEIFYRTKK